MPYPPPSLKPLGQPRPDAIQLPMTDYWGTYLLRYGGRCRECADNNGVCPATGLPCRTEDALAAVVHVLHGINYGLRYGYLDLTGDDPLHVFGTKEAFSSFPKSPNLGNVSILETARQAGYQSGHEAGIRSRAALNEEQSLAAFNKGREHQKSVLFWIVFISFFIGTIFGIVTGLSANVSHFADRPAKTISRLVPEPTPFTLPAPQPRRPSLQ